MNVDAIIKIRELFAKLDRAAQAAYIQYMFDNNPTLRANKHRFDGVKLPDNFWDAVQLFKERLPDQALEAWKYLARNEKRPYVFWNTGYDAIGTPFIQSLAALEKVLSRLVEQDGSEQYSRWQLEAGELYDSLKGN